MKPSRNYLRNYEKTDNLFRCLFVAEVLNAQEYKLNDKGYFNYEGIDAMAFDDFYPEGWEARCTICSSYWLRRICYNVATQTPIPQSLT